MRYIHFFKILLFLHIVMFYGQNVGINTDTPEQTLDVNGTMRISNTTNDGDITLPLSWDPSNQQVSKGTKAVDTPFYYITYKINLSINGSDWAKWIDLGIDSNKYFTILSQANLVKTRNDNEYYNTSNKDNYASHLLALLSHPVHLPKGNHIIKVINGLIYTEQDGRQAGFIVKPEKYIKVAVPENKSTYHFYGDYANTKPYKNGKYTWLISVLVMNKEWVSVLD